MKNIFGDRYPDACCQPGCHCLGNGHPDEAKAMSQKAAALVNDQGEGAFAVFAAKDGGFLEKDLYVFCMDLEGNMLSHAVNPNWSVKIFMTSINTAIICSRI